MAASDHSASGEQIVPVGDGLELCYEAFGAPADPTLPGGVSPPARYDNRDTGRSTPFKGFPPPNALEIALRRPRRLAYTLDDMADDGIRLLDHLGAERAHVVGASMGGMIAQVMTGRHPDRVLSLTSIMSTTGNRFVGNPALRVYPFFLGRPPRDREAYVERIEKLFAVIGSPGFDRDPDEFRQMARMSYHRDSSTS